MLQFFYLIFPYLFLLHPIETDIPVKGYKLYWSDEFNGKELDLSKWNYRGLGKRDDAYLSEKSILLNGEGQLIMKVFSQSDTVFAGMISTENILKIKYGYFECRARFKNPSGTIAAFWLQSPRINTLNGTPENDGVELDIFEYFPNLSKHQILHTIHWGGYGATHKVAGPTRGKLKKTLDDFHTIGFEWTANSYTTFVDGEITYSGNQLISQVPEFMILSLGVNSLAAGPLNLGDLPGEFIIDYVRVYKKYAN